MDQPFNNLSLDDEIVVKEKDGSFKVLKNGKLSDLNSSAEKNTAIKTALTPALEKPVLSEYDLAAQEIMEEIQKSFTFDDQALKGRFKNIVVSRLRGVRDLSETREILLRSAKIGGMEMPLADAEKAVQLIESKFLASAPSNGKVLEKIPYITEEEHPITKKMEPPAVEKKPESNQFTQAREDILKLIQEIPDYQVLPNIGSKANAAKNEPKQGLNPPVAPLNGEKTVLMPQDLEKKVKKELPKLLGPIDELREIDVLELRRLGKTPSEATGKIKEKLDILEKDSFTKKADGIAAWRQSKVYKLYLQMGRQSILEKIPIEQVIEKMKSNGSEFLTIEEFHAVMDLNEELRF